MGSGCYSSTQSVRLLSCHFFRTISPGFGALLILSAVCFLLSEDGASNWLYSYFQHFVSKQCRPWQSHALQMAVDTQCCTFFLRSSVQKSLTFGFITIVNLLPLIFSSVLVWLFRSSVSLDKLFALVPWKQNMMQLRGVQNFCTVLYTALSASLSPSIFYILF